MMTTASKGVTPFFYKNRANINGDINQGLDLLTGIELWNGSNPSVTITVPCALKASNTRSVNKTRNGGGVEVLTDSISSLSSQAC